MRRVGRESKCVLLGLVSLALISMPVSATTLLSMTIEELTNNSDSVVEGRVVSVESFWDATGRAILSEAVVQVTDTVKGDEERRIRVQTFGGQVGDFNIVADGFPVFGRGERVLLFVNQREALDGSIRVTGHQLGHYRIVQRGAEDVAVPTLDTRTDVVRGDAPTELPLQALKDQVRDIASRNGNSN